MTNSHKRYNNWLSKMTIYKDKFNKTLRRKTKLSTKSMITISKNNNYLLISECKMESISTVQKSLYKLSDILNSKISYQKIPSQKSNKEITNWKNLMHSNYTLLTKMLLKSLKSMKKSISSSPKSKISNKIYNILINLPTLINL